MRSFLHLFLSLAVLTLLGGCSTERNQQESATGKRVLLAVFAHPDDETTVTPVLAKYAAEGVDVYLAIATDGRYGVTEHAGIPAGDSLASVRAAELDCAAEKLGIHKPIRFNLHDQFKMQGGYVTIHDQLDTLRTEVKRLFEELKPDAVITWGASGWSGHHDHRLVSAVVTEVFESRNWDKPVQLFYPAVPTGKLPEGSGNFATVDSTFLTVRVEASEADYEKAAQSLHCHSSQYTPEQMAGMRSMITKALGRDTWFRPHHGTATQIFP